MKISALRTLIKEAISDMELSLELSNGKIIHGLARKDPKALSLQIGNNTYFSFWEGKFILSGTGDVTIVGGVDDYSQEWFLKATEEYLAAMEDAYPERFKYNTTGPIGMNESTSRTIIIKSTKEWEDLANNFKGYKYSGSLKPVSANRGLIQLSNYAKYPYEVMIDDKAKTIEFGEHSLKENKMKKQDIIRIINEEIEFALEEQEKQLYKVVDDKGKVIKPDEESDVDGLIKKIATKLAAKNPKWSVEKINEMYDPIYDSMLPEIVASLIASGVTIRQIIKFILEKYKNKRNGDKLDKDTIVEIIKKAKSKLNELKATNKGKDITKHLNDYLEGKINKSEFEKLTGLKKESINENTKPLIVVYDGKRLAIEPEDLERLKSGKDIVGKNLKYAGQEEWIYANGDWKIKEPINENEGMTKSLKDIDASLSLTKFNTTPPSFKVEYIKKEDMSKELEEEIVAWVLSKGGKVQRVSNEYELEFDNDRHFYPNVYFKF